MYLSPLRQEHTASFHVNALKNVWFDFGLNKGGDVVDFVAAYLESCGEDHTVADCLRWLDNMIPVTFKITRSATESFSKANPNINLISVKPLQNKSLIRYLDSRGISLHLAKKYLKEVQVLNKLTGNKFYALGFLNEDKGYELRNPLFKGCVAPKTITFIRGAKPLTKDVHVFEGFMDLLSSLFVVKKDKLDGDCIVLNSVSCLSQALPYLNNYGYKNLYSWMDNDAAGKKATLRLEAFSKQQQDLKHKPMNHTYATFKDVNAAHLHKLGLKKLND